MSNPTLTLDASVLTFHSWRNRPQRPSPVVDFATRIGDGSVHTQTVRSQANVVTSVAMIIYSNADEATIGTAYDADIAKLDGMLGKRCIWTDEQSRTISNTIPLAYTVSLVRKDGNANLPTYMATFNISVIVDAGVA